MTLRTELDLQLPGIRGKWRIRKAFQEHPNEMYKIMDSIEKVYPLLSQASARWTTRALISNILENAAGHKRRSRSSKERCDGVENSGENVSMDESTPKRQRRPKKRKTNDVEERCSSEGERSLSVESN